MGSSRRARRAFLAIAVAAAGVLVGGVVVDGDRPSLDVAVGEGDASPRSRGTVPSETTTTTDLAEPETPAVETSTTASTGRPAITSTTRGQTTSSSTAVRPTTTTAPASTTTTVRSSISQVPSIDGPGIYLLDVTGGGLRKIGKAGWEPGFSPDGEWVAYVTDDDPSVAAWDVYVTNLASGATRKVGEGHNNGRIGLAWSPDSRRLAFPGGGSPQGRDLVIVDVAGSAPPIVVAAPGDDAMVAWSSRGHLAVGNQEGLHLVDPQTGTRTLAWSTPMFTSPGPMHWSPDGRYLAGFPDSVGNWVLFDMETGTGQLRSGDANGRSPRDGRWAPDSSSVAVSIWDIDAETDRVHVVGVPYGGKTIASARREPSWSPRGDLLAAYSPDGLVFFGPDGTGERLALRLPPSGQRRPAAWSPDGSTVALAVS